MPVPASANASGAAAAAQPRIMEKKQPKVKEMTRTDRIGYEAWKENTLGVFEKLDRMNQSSLLAIASDGQLKMYGNLVAELPAQREAEESAAYTLRLAGSQQKKKLDEYVGAQRDIFQEISSAMLAESCDELRAAINARCGDKRWGSLALAALDAAVLQSTINVKTTADRADFDKATKPGDALASKWVAEMAEMAASLSLRGDTHYSPATTDGTARFIDCVNLKIASVEYEFFL